MQSTITRYGFCFCFCFCLFVFWAVTLQTTVGVSNDDANDSFSEHFCFIQYPVSAPPQPPKLFRKPSIERELPQFPRNSPALDSGAGSSRSNSTTESATIYDTKPIEYCKQMDYCKPIDFCKPIEFGKHVTLQQCSNQRLPGKRLEIMQKRLNSERKKEEIEVIVVMHGIIFVRYLFWHSNSSTWYISCCAAKWNG